MSERNKDTPGTPEECLDYLARWARGYYDPVCPDEMGDACSWALAEIGRLRRAVGEPVTPLMERHMAGNPYSGEAVT